MADYKKEETFFLDLFNNLSDAVFLQSLGGNFLKANNSALERLGYSKEEIIRMSPKDIDSPKYAKLISERISQILKKGSLVFETEHLTKEGRLIPTEVNAAFIKINEKPLILSIARDISKRKNQEESLKENINFLNNLLETIPNPIYYKNLSGEYLGCNSAFSKMIGLPKEEILGKTVNEISPEELSEIYQKMDNLLIQKGDTQIYESKVKSQDKKIYEIKFHKAIYKDISGTPLGIVGNMVDITKIKKSEEELKKSLSLIEAQNKNLILLVKEKEKLQEMLDNYSKQLELKIRKIDKSNIPLTEKEKIVFYGLVSWPWLNDKKLAEKLKLKRSTVTSIRVRLFKEKWLELVNLPNFQALGCESFSLVRGNLQNFSKEKKELEASKLGQYNECILNLETNSNCLAILSSKKFTEIKKIIDVLCQKGLQLTEDSNQIHFFYELNRIFINLPEFINSLFDLNFSLEPRELFQDKLKSISELNYNEKKILNCLIEFPEFSIAQISKKAWISKPTVSKIKKKLFKEGFFTTTIVPNIQKLNITQLLIARFKFDLSANSKISLLHYKTSVKEQNTLMKIIDHNEVYSIMAFKDSESIEKELDKIKEFYKKNHIPFQQQIFSLPLENNWHLSSNLKNLSQNLISPEDY